MLPDRCRDGRWYRVADHPRAILARTKKDEFVAKALEPCALAERDRAMFARMTEATARKAVESRRDSTGWFVPREASVCIEMPMAGLMARKLKILWKVDSSASLGNVLNAFYVPFA
ncbi:MAG TPA: hypothetical protein VLJ80_08370 [Solirubrobacteraceae bacterium]|nr:hypothetical protein [Solirubrobacteraceae bacterium]